MALPTPCPFPAHSPMAVSSHLGLFQVSVMALPVTETTLGGPSGGVGTTSAGGGQGRDVSMATATAPPGEGWRGWMGPAIWTGFPAGAQPCSPCGANDASKSHIGPRDGS